MKTIALKSGETIELNQAFNMDCLDFMRELPDKCIDLVLTDPPYGINIIKSQNSLAEVKFNGNRIKYDYKNWDNKIPEQDIFNEIFRVSKKQIIWGGNYFNLPPSKCWLIWDKIQRDNRADGEMAWSNMDKPMKVYRYARADAYINDCKSKIHPTQKPDKLFGWCLKNYTKENQIIFDPFLGSFTTAIASENLNLNWLGCELDPDYFKSGYHRYEQETKQMLMEF